jgi:hypothetical protein
MRIQRSAPIVLVTLTLALATSGCSMARRSSPPPSSAGMGDFMAQYTAAQKAAVRAGDEALSCDALQTQLLAMNQDPAVQDYLQSAGAMVQQDAAAGQQGEARAATQTALTLMSSLGSMGAMAGMTGMAAQHQSQQVDAMRNMQQRAAQMQQMMAILPQMLRGQRLTELAQQRKCSWAP